MRSKKAIESKTISRIKASADELKHHMQKIGEAMQAGAGARRRSPADSSSRSCGGSRSSNKPDIEEAR